jgi:uncharacterized protein (TIGR03067 family)
MIRHMLVVVALGVALAGCASKKAPQEAFTLAGVWEPVKAELGGEDLPVSTFGGATLELTSDTYAFAGDRGTYELLSAKLLSAKSAGEMDIYGREGPNAGHTIPAIYDLKGDELRICYELGDGSRPREFATRKGARVLYIRYKRVH